MPCEFPFGCGEGLRLFWFGLVSAGGRGRVGEAGGFGERGYLGGGDVGGGREDEGYEGGEVVGWVGEVAEEDVDDSAGDDV